MIRLALAIGALALPACAAEPEGTPLSCAGVSTSEWFAWNDLMPPTPNHFHVTAKVEVGNPGVVASLTERELQGADIALELALRQKPGQWIQQVTTVDVRFDKPLRGTEKPAKASILCEGKEIQSLDVGDVH
jgi:hypothetical protein